MNPWAKELEESAERCEKTESILNPAARAIDLNDPQERAGLA